MLERVAGGVNLANEENFSKFAGHICRQSYQNCPFITVHDLSNGHFRGPRGFTLNTETHPVLRGTILTAAPDGVGTKVIVISVGGRMRSSAANLLAMTGGDITRRGGLRVCFINVLDVKDLGEPGDPVNQAFRELMMGLSAAAAEQQIVIFNGETAELGICVGSEDPSIPVQYNWSGVMIGVYHPERMIIGNTIKEGQVIVGLQEHGLRSNGFRTARAALARAFGAGWWKGESAEARAAIEAVAAPSVIYDPIFEYANGWTGDTPIPIHAIAHLSGGAIPSKLGADLLKPLGLSADLDDLFDPPPIMRQCREWLGDDEDGLSVFKSYKQWHGGQGALVVLDEQDVDDFISLAALHGKSAKTCGKVTKNDTPQISITSKYGDGAVLTYPLE